MKKIHLDHVIEKFVQELEAQKSKPLYKLTPQEARGVLKTVQKQSSPMEPLTDALEITVKLKDKSKMRVVLIKPLTPKHDLPIIFYIHGGGWVMGDETTHARLIRELAVSSKAAVVFPIYTPSPESQYPKTTEDLFEVLRHIVNFADKYGLDNTRLAVAGDSVGANMAVVMSLMALKRANKPKISFELLFYPVTNAEFETPSYQEYKDGPWLTREAMKWFWDQYAPNKDQQKEIFASILKADLETLKLLSPTLIITAENDVLRDEGEAFAEKLNTAGVDVACVRINGAIHDFVMLNALKDSQAAQTAVLLASQTLQKVFSHLPTHSNT